MEFTNPFTNAKVVGKDVDADTYHRQTAKRGDKNYIMGHGELMVFAANPWKWLHGYREDVESGAATWGQLIDTRVLSPDFFDKRFAVRPLTYETTGMQCPTCGTVTDSQKCSKCKTDRKEVKITKDWSGNSTTCQAWVEAQEQAGKLILTADALEAGNVAVERIQDNADAAHAIAGDSQVHCTADYVDEATGLTIPVRILVDCVPLDSGRFNKALADLKTTRSASPRQWGKDVFNFGYACQAGMYLDVYCAATGEDRLEWIHLISENIAPYYCEARMLSEEFVAIGRNRYLTALKEYSGCLASGEWRGYKSQRNIFGLALTEPEPYMTSAD